MQSMMPSPSIIRSFNSFKQIYAATSTEKPPQTIDLESSLPQESKTNTSLFDHIFSIKGDKIRNLEWIDPYLEYIQQELELHQIELLDPVLSRLTGSNNVDDKDRVEFVGAVATALKATRSKNRTVENIIVQVCELYEVTDERVSEKEIGQAIFLMLGWLSMLFKPQVDLKALNSLQVLASSDFPRQPFPLVKRPITSVLKKLGVILPDSTKQGNEIETSELYVSNLNYSSLSSIGGVRIKWVDTLDQHLDFDPRTRTLRLFRFPSLCALSYVNGIDNCFDRMISEYYQQADLAEEYKREVLRSYRVIFGQTGRARKLFNTDERKNAQGALSTCDPLLVELCGRSIPKFPLCKLQVDLNQFRPEPMHYSKAEFFLFREKLDAIQRHISQQRPTRIQDMWRDHRDPLQWYTVWAVLAIAVISMCLSLVQAIVGICQLYFSIHCNQP
ncbi:hypothetical protein F5B20DRAFT_415933 [Whalleya microplaca]|nr:hypothetical protein F5B20DRAFT_415933 [Whalleya microplaca]